MKRNLLSYLLLSVILSQISACTRHDVNVSGSPEQQEEQVLLVQMANRLAALDWKTKEYNWTTQSPGEIVKGGSKGELWYILSSPNLEILKSWDDTTELTVRPEQEFIATFDPLTGKRLLGVPNKLKPDYLIESTLNNPSGLPADGRRSSVTLYGDKAYVVSNIQQAYQIASSTLYAVDLKTGDIDWSYEWNGENVSQQVSFGSGEVFIGTNHTTILDINTGKKIKELPLGGGRVVGDKYIFGWVYGHKLTVADLKTGVTKWETGTEGGTQNVEQIIVSGEMALLKIQDVLHIVAAETGMPKWTVSNLAEYKDIMIANGVVFVIDKELKVQAFDLTTGQKKWESVSFQVSEFDGRNMKILTGKTKIYLQHKNNQLIELDPATGKTISESTFWAGDLGPINKFKILY